MAAVGEAARRFGIEPGAPQPTVRDAWRRELKRFRPDRGGISGADLARLVDARVLLLATARPAAGTPDTRPSAHLDMLL